MNLEVILRGSTMIIKEKLLLILHKKKKFRNNEK